MSNPKKAASWSSDSIHGGLLFACFADRVFHPNSYSATEIFDHPQLPFGCYSRRNFKTYCQTIANRCIKFEKNGTGLTPDFQKFIKAARQEHADLLKQLREPRSDYDSAEDESYRSEEEDDLPFEADQSVEESLSALMRDARFDIRHSLDRNQKKKLPEKMMLEVSKKPQRKKIDSKPAVPTFSSPSSRMLSLRDPYVLEYPSHDKLFCQLPMGGNVDEDDDFRVEIMPWRIQAWLRIPSELESAYDLLGTDGRLADIAENCPHCMVFQAAIDERIRSSEIKRDEQDQAWVLEYDLETPFEVMVDYYDTRGMKMNNFMIQSNGLGYFYAQFWLKAVPRKKEGTNRTVGRRVGKARRNW
jgi:hypothetical protein